jgi:hypothetical protein
MVPALQQNTVNRETVIRKGCAHFQSVSEMNEALWSAPPVERAGENILRCVVRLEGLYSSAKFNFL